MPKVLAVVAALELQRMRFAVIEELFVESIEFGKGQGVAGLTHE
jgi:hypothetical protein